MANLYDFDWTNPDSEDDNTLASADLLGKDHNPNNDFYSLYNQINAPHEAEVKQAKSPLGPLDIISNGSKLVNLGTKPASSGILSGLTQGVNNFGANVLGTAEPLPWNPTAGFMNSGSWSGASTLTGVLGEAGVGGLIGTLNPWAKNKTGSQIGGAIGGVAGGELLGATLGSALFPGAGTIIGAAAGSLLGGLIGGGRKHPAASFDTTIGTAGTLDQATYKSKHIGTDEAKMVQNNYQTYLSGISKDVGIDITGQRVYGGVDDGKYFIGAPLDPKIMGKDAVRYTFDPNDKKSVRSAFANATIDLVKQKNGGKIDAQAEDLIRNYSIKTTPPGGMFAGAQVTAPMIAGKGQSQSSFSNFVTQLRNPANKKVV